MESKKFVISDLHGCYDDFIKILELINFKSQDEIYILGDAINKGPQSLKTLQFIKEEENMIFTLGNHEEDFLNALLNKKFQQIYTRNPNNTFIQEFKALSSRKQKELIKFLYELDIYKYLKVNDKDYILTHSGLTNVKRYDTVKSILKKQSQKVLEDNTKFIKSNIQTSFTTIFGHTPIQLIRDRKYGPYLAKQRTDYNDVYYGKSQIGIDGGSVNRDDIRQLFCLELNDMKEYKIPCRVRK